MDKRGFGKADALKGSRVPLLRGMLTPPPQAEPGAARPLFGRMQLSRRVRSGARGAILDDHGRKIAALHLAAVALARRLAGNVAVGKKPRELARVTAAPSLNPGEAH